MGKFEGDEKILSFNDVVLRKSDLEILSGPYFLNDRIIEFYFSYLSTTHPSNDILLSPPSIAFWIMNCPDVESLNGFLEPLNLRHKKLVIFPVNDNSDVSKPEGGNHWSLLAFYREANIFVHHDSNKGMNKYDAKRLYKAVARFMNDGSNSTSNPSYMECVESPQQVNGYDCGVYVTAIARSICKWYEERREVEKDGLWFSAVVEEISPLLVANMRREILELIRSLMAVKEYQPATK
ncbi:NEDD8-specific protease 1 [Cucumis melo var. makuwa]|uniref:NEDD8-specific protease 1 n=2 Tax=Cucumis melo TaxID=3656 RepID=A0A5D3CSG4_CUCMM|nr:NEDD8-specific protease 1 [Cucumis melo var. makuwa]TYK14342.1 NEDD8-specific protease 1 [Cucumis melo var. makuwa]